MANPTFVMLGWVVVELGLWQKQAMTEPGKAQDRLEVLVIIKIVVVVVF